MNLSLAVLSFAVLSGVLLLTQGEGAGAIAILLPLVALIVWMICREGLDREFLVRLFIGALIARILVGTLIYAFHAQDFFGGDALTYDFYGTAQLKAWGGDKYYQGLTNRWFGSSGWGMMYLVAAIYRIIGRNMLAVQFVNAALGAATSAVTYLIAANLFGHTRTARVTALLSAFLPSLVIWSSQGLKDGPIIFLIALSMLAAVKLRAKLQVKWVLVLALTLLALLAMRFYIFYMVILAIVSGLFFGIGSTSAKSLIRQVIAMSVIALALFYFGATHFATNQYETYVSLKEVQLRRIDMARSASGFQKDADVSTPSGALGAMPLGVAYLLLAPFPWQLGSVRQAIALPEMILWWSSLPLLILGLGFSLRHRLGQTVPILVFTTLLTLAYSIFQGNVGTAYRQRAQLLVFYLIFVSVGFVLFNEKRAQRRQCGTKMNSRRVLSIREDKA
ncbi:MAG TPA: glycosyltransferase family 39 protein [Pyrinomonadaceae bacterium]|nr:glycosyltransferase family 39 protein [Pyrinomonadaceae bacterium]